MAADFAGWPALYDLSPGSEFLETVNSAPLPVNVPFTSIYTCTDEYIQPYETSIIPGAKNIGLCDGFVGHFEFFYNPDIYLVMHGALTEPLPGETVDPPDAPDADDTTEEANEDLDDAIADGGDVGEGGEEAGLGGCTAGGAADGGSGAFVMLVLGAASVLARRRRGAGS
jgi:MYXO-CTERM domain-containing protein